MSYFNMRSKAEISQILISEPTNKSEKEKSKKIGKNGYDKK